MMCALREVKVEFHKELSKYYDKWFRDCHDSAVYLKNKGKDAEAKEYLEDAAKYFDILNENWNAIEYYSIGDNAHKVERKDGITTHCSRSDVYRGNHSHSETGE